MPISSTKEALAGVRSTLATARLGLSDFTRGKSEVQRMAGLRNTIVWGRAVTQSLHHLKTFEGTKYETWYEPWRHRLESTQDFQYIYDLRNQLLKEGYIGNRSANTVVGRFSSAMLESLPRPPHAVAFFIGDSLGGNGWTVQLPDGSRENYYVELPQQWGITSYAMFVEPTTQKKIPPPTIPIDRLLTQYLRFLSDMVESAEKAFA